MESKRLNFAIQGMTRDWSPSKFNPKFAFENKNLRIVATENSTTASIENERGTSKVESALSGTPIGHAVINDQLVVFTHGNSEDHIYKLFFSGTPETLQVQELYSGPLGFSVAHPIECTTFYENEELQKVYWTDNDNPLRVINIAATQEERTKWTNVEAPFDFVGPIGTDAKVTITKRAISGGMFAPGVIQYSFSYFNLYGKESNIFYTSPLYYTSNVDRGGEADTSVSNAFDITLENLDPNYDYVRIYSTLRTSLDAIPQARKVADVRIKPEQTIPIFIKSYSYTRPSDGTSVLGPYSNQKVITAYGDDLIYIENSYSEGTGELVPIEDYLANPNSQLTGKKHRFLVLKNPDNPVGVIADYYATESNLDDSNTIAIDPSSTNKRLVLTDTSFYLGYKENVNVSVTVTPSSKTVAANIYYTDTGNYNEAIAPTDLLYVGGESVTAKTLDQKDNTLFIGNITSSKDNRVSDGNKTILSAGSITCGEREAMKDMPTSGYYPYQTTINSNSNQIKGFKRGDVYRLGVQLQTKDGRWTQPVYLEDKEETSIPSIKFPSNYNQGPSLYTTKFTYTLNSNISTLAGKYSKIRPVVVFPSESDRNIICQGIVNPTVFNVKDRMENGPYVQASWFFRPNAPFEVGTTDDETNLILYPQGTHAAELKYTPKGVMTNEWDNSDSDFPYSLGTLGEWVEFRHNTTLPANTHRNAEIQCMQTTRDSLISNDFLEDFLMRWPQSYYVDQSIFTLNSPEIEYRDKFPIIQLNNAHFKIVGYAELGASQSATTVDTTTSQLPYISRTTWTYGAQLTPGFIDRATDIDTNLFFPVGSGSAQLNYDSLYGWRTCSTLASWWDTAVSADPQVASIQPIGYDTNFSSRLFCYVIYPWQRSGALNNDDVRRDVAVSEVSANLKHKVLSNIRVSYNTIYLPNNIVWDSYNNANGIETPVIWDSEEQTLEKIGDKIYYGNVDKLVFPSTIDYSISVVSPGFQTMEGTTKQDCTYIAMPALFNVNGGPVFWNESTKDRVPIKYKSTPHIVIALKPQSLTEDNVVTYKQYILPTHRFAATPVNDKTATFDSDKQLFWDSSIRGVIQNSISVSPRSGYLWIGELYNPDVNEETRFGGKSEEAIENNTWVPCGEPVSLTEDDGTVKSSITLEYTEGDTYYQRYDCLKTYPYTKEDLNSVVEIVSFMVETHINLDGRYDRNRGLKDNTNVSKTNFNLLNPVYTQKNNFFNYTLDRSNRINLKKYPTTFSWSLPKVSGEAVDSWTSVTLANTYELDGRFGELNAIRKFNDGLFTFQDKGISQILYNDNVQIATSTGVPIEIANSGKVQGVRYLSTDIGCTNKFSICRTPNGLYFVDSLAKDIYLFNGQFSNLSDKNGFHTWVNSELSNIGEWNPSSVKNCITFYDRTTGDVRFTTNTQCLTFSETTGNFSSFFDYEDTPVFGNIKNRGVMLHKEGLGNTYYPWLFREGNYNSFFGVTKPFYTTLWVNPDGQLDKVFTNIEFRADTWNGNTLLNNTTFDKLTAHTEYQDGSVNLSFGKGISNLKKKFRIWRANIPRDLNRQYMRNPWLQLQLKMNSPSTYRTELHDIAVDYFI